MKNYELKMLDEDDHIFIKTLSNLGMPRSVATTMAYLLNVDEATSQEIEMSTGLRQPEVSLAIKFMSKQSWINVRTEKKSGKGRPMKVFSLLVQVEEIISYYEDMVYKESQATISAVKKLKIMSKNMSIVLSN